MKNQNLVAAIVLLQITSFCALKADNIRPGSSVFTDSIYCDFIEIAIENGTDSLANSDKKLKMTSIAYGGAGVLFTKINYHPAVMTGGRGSATFNNRYTFGGGGWGMPKGVEVENNRSDTLEFFKFGYGGFESGYIFYEGQRLRLGSNLLAGVGVGFQETFPKMKGEVKVFPVFESSIYSQFALGKLLRLDIGLTYRFVTGSNFSFINNRQLSGPSIYFAFLVGTCNCK